MKLSTLIHHCILNEWINGWVFKCIILQDKTNKVHQWWITIILDIRDLPCSTWTCRKVLWLYCVFTEPRKKILRSLNLGQNWWGKQNNFRKNYFSFCTGKFWSLQKIHPLNYRRLSPHVSYWEKVFFGPVTSRDRRHTCNTALWPLCLFCFKVRLTSWMLGT